MITTHTPATRAPSRTAGAVVAMSAGLVLTVIATLAPYVDRATGHVLADHIRNGYPSYTADRVDSAVTTWLAVLTVIGVLGVLGWGLTIWAVKAHKSWARPTATILFLAGASLALAAALTRDSSGEVGLAPVLGWIQTLPSVAGLVAVVILWATPSPRSRRA